MIIKPSLSRLLFYILGSLVFFVVGLLLFFFPSTGRGFLRPLMDMFVGGGAVLLSCVIVILAVKKFLSPVILLHEKQLESGKLLLPYIDIDTVFPVDQWGDTQTQWIGINVKDSSKYADFMKNHALGCDIVLNLSLASNTDFRKVYEYLRDRI